VAEIEIEHRENNVLPWIVGLALLVLLLAGLIFALSAPRAVGEDDGTAPVGNVHEERNEPERQPRSMRQYAKLSPAASPLLRAA
jgi:hypothetical protein